MPLFLFTERFHSMPHILFNSTFLVFTFVFFFFFCSTHCTFWFTLYNTSDVCVDLKFSLWYVCTYDNLHTNTHLSGPGDKFIQVSRSLIHYVCDLFPFIQIILITRYCAFLWLMLVHLLPLALLSSQLHVHVTLMDSVSNVAFLFFYRAAFLICAKKTTFNCCTKIPLN